MDILNFIVVLVALTIPTLMIAVSQATGSDKSLDILSLLHGTERAKDILSAAERLPLELVVGINAIMILVTTWVYASFLPALSWLEIMLLLSSTVILALALSRRVPTQLIVIALIASALGWFGPVLRLAA